MINENLVFSKRSFVVRKCCVFAAKPNIVMIPIPTRKWHSESADPSKALDLCLVKQTNKQTDEQTDKQKVLSTQRFQLSTFAFLAQCSYRLSYRAVLI